VNPIITPIEPRQDAAAEVERLRYLIGRALDLLVSDAADDKDGRHTIDAIKVLAEAEEGEA
jgi:flagellar biosynthesis regulator FlaF